MAVKNLYPNLPGHLVEFKDGGLQVTSNEIINGYDKSLLILGTALDGPINEPVKISPTTVSQVFGSEVNERGYPNGATLTKYAKQAFKNGFSDVRCMRVTGKQASAEVIKSEEAQTEVVEAQPITIRTEGTTNEVEVALNCIPITNRVENGALSSVRLSLVETTGGMNRAIMSNFTYGPYSGNLKLKAGILSKNPSLAVKYGYMEVSDANGVINEASAGQSMASLPNYHTVDPATMQITRHKNSPISRIRAVGDTAWETGNVPIFDSDGNAISYEVDATPNDGPVTGVYLYKTPYNNHQIADDSGKFPITAEGVDVVVHRVLGSDNDLEETLTLGTDYEIVNGNQIRLIDTTNYEPDDLICVEYFTYQYKNAEEVIESSDVNETSDKITIPVIPVDGSIVVKMKGDDNNFSPVSQAHTSYNTGYELVTKADSVDVVFPAGYYKSGVELMVEYQVNDVISDNESFTIIAKYGGKVYNGATVNIEEETRDGVVGRRLTFTKPSSKLYGTGDKPFYFTSFDCVTVGELKIALGRYALNNVFDIICDDENMALADIPVGIAVLDGGDDGLNPTNNEMYEALSGVRNSEGYLLERGSYQILENYHCDYIYVAGVYGDSKQTVNKYSSFQHELALLCAVLTYRTKMTHGFMDVKPNSNTTLVGIQKYVDRLTAMENLHYMMDDEGNDIVDNDGNKMDIGWYTSLVVGPDPVMISDKLGTYYASAAIAYAALCASIKPQSAPTNKALPGVKGMKYRLSNKQMDALVANRMVCFRLKNEGVTTASSVPYCVDGVTCGAPNCDYSRMSTVKTVTDVVDQVREVCDPFIGEPNTVEQRNAMSALISKRLSYLMEQGEIQSYEFEINATIEQVLIGECTIALTLVPAMELRRITTVVSLRAAA